MANIEKIKQSAVPFVDDGEHVQAVFFGQSISPWWAFAPVTVCIGVFSALHANLILMAAVAAASPVPVSLITKYRNVIVTDRRTLVLARSRWRVGKVSSIVRELPRTTLIGPAIGTHYETQALGGDCSSPRATPTRSALPTSSTRRGAPHGLAHRARTRAASHRASASSPVDLT